MRRLAGHPKPAHDGKHAAVGRPQRSFIWGRHHGIECEFLRTTPFLFATGQHHRQGVRSCLKMCKGPNVRPGRLPPRSRVQHSRQRGCVEVGPFGERRQALQRGEAIRRQQTARKLVPRTRPKSQSASGRMGCVGRCAGPAQSGARRRGVPKLRTHASGTRSGTSQRNDRGAVTEWT